MRPAGARPSEFCVSVKCSLTCRDRVPGFWRAHSRIERSGKDDPIVSWGVQRIERTVTRSPHSGAFIGRLIGDGRGSSDSGTHCRDRHESICAGGEAKRFREASREILAGPMIPVKILRLEERIRAHDLDGVERVTTPCQRIRVMGATAERRVEGSKSPFRTALGMAKIARRATGS